MIISHTHKFIFCKTSKVAGTSIEIELSNLLNEDDVVTKISAEDEKKREHLKSNINFENRIGKSARGEDIELFNHSSLLDAYRLFGEKIIEYTVVTAERNPWDKALSHFFWSFKTARELDIKAQVAAFRKMTRAPRKNNMSDFDLYCLRGVPVADIVIRYEHIGEDLAKFFDKIGCVRNEEEKIAEAKAGVRPTESRNLDLFYDRDARKLIEIVSAREIALMGYVFDRRDCPPFEPLACRHEIRRGVADRLQTGGRRGSRQRR